MSSLQISEMSKTYQYRKVMKPMLERKRRARINKCLDELKDLMVATLESEGEHVTRLEKADILELTVTHLQKLKRQRKLGALNGGGGGGAGGGGAGMTQAEGFRSGYIHAVNEVSRSLSELPGVNVNLGTQLMTHLGQRLNQLQPPVRAAVPLHTPLSVHIAAAAANGRGGHYSVPISPVSSYTGSPNSTCSQSLLTTCTPHSVTATTRTPSIDVAIDVVADDVDVDDDVDDEDVDADVDADDDMDSEENVWRPW